MKSPGMMKPIRILSCFAPLTMALVLIGISSGDSSNSMQPGTKAATQTAPKARTGAAPAARLNTLGIAYMGQQSFEQALNFFEQAYAANPKFLAARANQGIALVNLQRV